MHGTSARELGTMSSLSASELPIALPGYSERFEQDCEWCVARVDGEWREFRFHDYDRLYEVEGLYERIFYDVLRCDSPPVVRQHLDRALRAAGVRADELRGLDLGAGNGIMGRELLGLGFEAVVGVDIIPEAAEAAERDRPGTYADYYVVDMTDLDDETRASMTEHRFNALTCVAALGFGDIPPRAFSEAYNLVEPGGWVAFNIKEEFLDGNGYRSGFARLIGDSMDDGSLEIRVQERYRHRDATNGDPIHYVAMVGTKRRDIEHPED